MWWRIALRFPYKTLCLQELWPFSYSSRALRVARKKPTQLRNCRGATQTTEKGLPKVVPQQEKINFEKT
jgi:hypothetical protein